MGMSRRISTCFICIMPILVVYANTLLKNGGAAEDVIQEFLLLSGTKRNIIM